MSLVLFQLFFKIQLLIVESQAFLRDLEMLISLSSVRLKEPLFRIHTIKLYLRRSIVFNWVKELSVFLFMHAGHHVSTGQQRGCSPSS